MSDWDHSSCRAERLLVFSPLATVTYILSSKVSCFTGFRKEIVRLGTADRLRRVLRVSLFCSLSSLHLLHYNTDIILTFQLYHSQTSIIKTWPCSATYSQCSVCEIVRTKINANRDSSMWIHRTTSRVTSTLPVTLSRDFRIFSGIVLWEAPIPAGRKCALQLQKVTWTQGAICRGHE